MGDLLLTSFSEKINRRGGEKRPGERRSQGEGKHASLKRQQEKPMMGGKIRAGPANWYAKKRQEFLIVEGEFYERLRKKKSARRVRLPGRQLQQT